MNWAVATTKPNHESIAARGLDRLGVTNYTPRCRTQLSDQDRPLFPGYLFVAAGQVWRSVLGTCGITGVLGLRGDAPARLIADDLIQEIRDREVHGLVVLPEKIGQGDRVCVDSGRLFGHEGLCVGMDGRDRVWILLRVMERVVKFSFKRADLVLA